MIFKVISSLFLIVAVICLLGLTPKQISEDIISMTAKKESIRDRVHAVRTGKKKKSVGERLVYVQTSLESMGKGGKFAFVVCASLVLFVAGAVLAVFINNAFLVPVFALAFAVIPFVYVRNSMSRYEKHIKDELETTLSVITTSYLRNENIIDAVKENIQYIKPPLKEHFSAFIGDAAFVSNTKRAILNLRNKINDDIFREWCDALIQCQEDSTLKDTLQPIVSKLTDVRLVNSEISSMMAAVRMEYYTMVGLVAGNIPLLYVLNKDWFRTLMFETPGKITLGVCGAVILVTYLFMLKFTKPIEYKG